MVAFNASKFVCWAIELMTLLTLWISRLDVSSFFILSLADAAKSTASFATALESLAFFEISRIDTCTCEAARATEDTVVDTC